MEEKTMHTPGPWTFAKGESNLKPVPTDCFGTIVADDWILAEIKSDGPNFEADARLIAAAPQLLEALQDASLDAHIASCKSRRSGSGLEFSKCTYGPCQRWAAAIQAAKETP